jgi:hypothetical protein
MKAIFTLVSILVAGLFTGCSGMNAMNQTCMITAAVTPATATASHTAAPPGNQMAFSAASTVSGNCPLIADTLGSWSTSDPANTTVSTQANNPMAATVTCVNAAPAPVTVNYSGTTHGHPFTSATLTCN